MDRHVVLAVLVVIAGGALAATWVINESKKTSQAVVIAEPAEVVLPQHVIILPRVFVEPIVAIPATQPVLPAKVSAAVISQPKQQPVKKIAPAVAVVAITEPAAREALSDVGVDPEAEAVWISAINDPTLGDKERRELIEDLNDTGFPDHKNLTADDLPKIESRILLVEQLAPDAMDDINAAAFAEAHKDLVNMRAKLLGAG